MLRFPAGQTDTAAARSETRPMSSCSSTYRGFSAYQSRSITPLNSSGLYSVHAPTPSSLISLELYRLRETRLGPLLSVLNRLQKLRWHWYYQPNIDRDVSKRFIELDTMAEALSHVGHTLTDLTIEARAGPAILVSFSESTSLEMRGSLGGLAHLDQLRRLCVPWVFLMGFSPSAAKQLGDALPRNLELLTLTGDLREQLEWEWDADSIIWATKSGLESRTWPFLTNLHRIILPIPVYDSDMTEERRAKLRQISDHAGVDLEYQIPW